MSKYYTPTYQEIRMLRSRLDMSQPEFAELLMCSPATVSKWEQGVNQMPPMVWHASQIIVAKAEEDATPVAKPEKLTVYDKKKADQEAEEERKRLQQERYQQKIDERDRIEQERRIYLRGHIADLKERVGRKYPQVHKDFLDAESAYEITNAILKIENYYKQYRAEIDALTPDLLPYEFLANVVKFAQAE